MLTPTPPLVGPTPSPGPCGLGRQCPMEHLPVASGCQAQIGTNARCGGSFARVGESERREVRSRIERVDTTPYNRLGDRGRSHRIIMRLESGGGG